MSILADIVQFFPLAELPIILSEDGLSEFESANDPFSQSFIENVLNTWEPEADEFTEFIPIASFSKEEKYQAVVYWKGSLLRYDFVLATLDADGNLINKKSIASTIVREGMIQKSVAPIAPDYIINIIAGHSVDGVDYDPSVSKTYSMEVLANGHIIFSLNEGMNEFG